MSAPETHLFLRFWSRDDPAGLAIKMVCATLEHDAPPAPGLPLATHVSLERVCWLDGRQCWDGVEAVVPRVASYDPRKKDMRGTRLYQIRPVVSSTCNPPQGQPILGTRAVPVDLEALWGNAWARRGEYYNLPGLGAALWYCLWRDHQGFWDDPRALVFCSQMATVALRAGGIEPFPQDHRRDDQVTPPALELAAPAFSTRVQ